MVLVLCIIGVSCKLDLCELPYNMLQIRQFFISYIVISILVYFFARRKEKDKLSLAISYLTDNMTGLPNRQMFIEDLKTYKDPQIILINIDDFKIVNDFYGHDIGDYILIKMSERLQSFVKSTEHKIYKLHADEYAVLFLKKSSNIHH